LIDLEGTMLGIGRQTDYALRILLHLACLGENTQVPVKEIVAKRLLPPAYVRRIVARLAGAGLLRTARGAGGGVRLARPASEISMLDVVRVFEGGIVLNRCVDDPQTCPLTENCPVHLSWTSATEQVESYLDSVRFDQLAAHANDPILKVVGGK
jgi:Rrf2 family protein